MGARNGSFDLGLSCPRYFSATYLDFAHFSLSPVDNFDIAPGWSCSIETDRESSGLIEIFPGRPKSNQTQSQVIECGSHIDSYAGSSIFHVVY